jgi:hypothetical protein
LTNQLLCLQHDTVYQGLASGDIVNQTSHHPAAPCAGLDITIDHDFGVNASDLLNDVFDI